ncbi:MAG: hypothetical protein R3F59_12590 [Myxococcota bacterium]
MLDDLILVRLLPRAARPPTASRIATDLGALFRDPPDRAAVESAVTALCDAGAVTAEPLGLTPAGRARALRFLGLDALPARWSWRTLRARALPSRAVGLPPASASAAKVVASEDKLAARALQQRYDLPERAGSSVRAALEALVCRDLGHPGCATLDELAAAVLSARIGAERPLSPSALRKQVPRVLLGVSGGVDALRERLVADWTDPGEAPPEVPAVPDRRDEPDAFDAAAVLAAARACTTGRFGADKVLVHHVWRAIARPGLDLDAFKRRLVALNSAGGLALARADLVQLMDPDELARAEIRVGHATFHFVRAGATRP